MGFSPDHPPLPSSRSAQCRNFIDTATNSVKHITYIGRSPQGVLTIDGKEVWVTVRGGNAMLDGTTYEEKRGSLLQQPRMIFSPDRKYGMSAHRSCPRPTSSPSPTTRSSAGPAGEAVLPQHCRHADSSGLVYVERYRQGSGLRRASAVRVVEDTRHWSITNHVNIVRNANGMFAYVTVGGLSETGSIARTIFQSCNHSRGKLPHGI
jgi:hypothetical protein